MAANDVPQLSLTPSVKDPHKSQLHLLDGFRGENAGNRFAVVDFVILNVISIFFSWEYCYVSNFRGRSLPFHVTHSCSKSVKSLGGSVRYLNGWLVGWLVTVGFQSCKTEKLKILAQKLEYFQEISGIFEKKEKKIVWKRSPYVLQVERQCVCACVRACVRAYVRTCVCACVRVWNALFADCSNV